MPWSEDFVCIKTEEAVRSTEESLVVKGTEEKEDLATQKMKMETVDEESHNEPNFNTVVGDYTLGATNTNSINVASGQNMHLTTNSHMPTYLYQDVSSNIQFQPFQPPYSTFFGVPQFRSYAMQQNSPSFYNNSSCNQQRFMFNCLIPHSNMPLINQSHIEGHAESHVIPVTDYPCEFCSQRFSSIASLKKHEVTHVPAISQPVAISDIGIESNEAKQRTKDATGTNKKAKAKKPKEHKCDICFKV